MTDVPSARSAIKADGSHVRKSRQENRHKHHKKDTKHSRHVEKHHLAKHGLRGSRDHNGK